MSDEILAVVSLSETILEAKIDQNGPPQDVSPTATPVFNSVALTSLTEGQLVYVGPGKVLIPLALGPNLSITEGSLVVDGSGEGGGGNGTGIQEGDPRLTDSREWSAATMSTETAAAGVSTTRLATTAAVLRAAAAGWWDAISGAFGKSLTGATTAAQGRTLLELGSAAQAATTDFATPAALASGLAAKADLVGGVVPTSQIPAAPVQSVNGQVGVIVLGPGDVGAATAAQGALAATSIQPVDPRLTDAREWSAATMSTETAAAGVSTTRLATTAAVLRAAAAGWWDAISGAFGKSLTGATTAAQGRTLLELGSAAQAATTDFISATADPYASLAALFAGGTRQVVLFNGATGFSNGTGASTDTSSGTATGQKPNYGIYITGSTTTGFAGLSVIPVPVAFNIARGRFAIGNIARFRFSCLVWVPVLSDASNSFVCHFGLYADSGTYSQRRAVGAILIDNAIYAVATAAGVSVLSAAFATVTADTVIHLDIEYTGSVVSVRVNRGSPLTVNSGFPANTSANSMNAGAFISKTAGTTSREMHVALGAYMLAQLNFP